MAYPTVVVEVAFTTDPSDTPSWTDVTAYVDSIVSVDTGRDSELTDAFPAGRANLVLVNNDRRFEPEYAASPYYPNVVPMRRLRIRATYAAVTYDVFSGYVERWPLSYEGPQMSNVSIVAVDGFAALNQAGLPGSVWAMEVGADDPVAWYRLGESSGTTVADATEDRRHGAYRGGATFNSRAGLVAKDSNNAIEFVAEMAGVVNNSLLTGYPFSIEFWFKADTSASGLGRYFAYGSDLPLTGGTSAAVVGVFMLPGTPGQMRLAVTSAGTSRVVQTNASFDDNQVHHCVAVAASSSSFKVYIDGVDQAVSTLVAGSPVFPSTLAHWTFGNAPLHWSFDAPLDATLDEVAFYDTALSAGRVLAHYEAGTEPWAGDTSGERVDKILDAIGWPAADRDVDAGVSVLQAASLGGSALASLNAIARTEGGALHMTAAGKVRFRDRRALITPPLNVSQATYGDDPAELTYVDIQPSYDVDRVRNIIRRARVGGSPVESFDQTSRDAYFDRLDEQTDLLTVSDAEVKDAADWALLRRKDPALRFDELAVEPYGDDANQWPQMLGRKIGDRITVRRRPPGGGSMLEREVVIEAVRHRLGPALLWQTRWRLSPAEGAYWILGTSHLGTDTVPAY